ncbi:MAG TPA: inorganic phosphate transporter [Williamwhitmania sp.]|nr:inorganic phosphate transporter [Williamwhitmania sp.]
MDNFYLIAVTVLIILAVIDLVVGVSNDAVNFLNSAIGSQVAPRYIILIVASLGVILGSILSSGMMEIARKGIFHPTEFYFSEIMVIFMAVMITDIILLDLFNTFGLPTSTTVSLVFELLGSAVAVASVKILSQGGSLSSLSQYINTDKALAIISGILISVVVAFVTGTVVMYIARIIFSFNVKRTYPYFGAIFGGFAITALTYFIIMKGVQGTTLVPQSIVDYLNNETSLILLISFLGWSIILQLITIFFRFNIFRLIVLVGTFALALSFAGNDLVNFIGVSMAGLKSYQIFAASGVAADHLVMSQLAGPVATNTYYLLIAGLIMVATLFLSKKSRTVTETEVNLARQDSGVERFGSSQFSRSLVRQTMAVTASLARIAPRPIVRFIESRFDQTKTHKVYPRKNAANASFDLVRASVNLTIASILISTATSLKLPLSTTYVTFMVAMGSSLADRAWGRESAVYRITGVVTVISGWFFTALIAFSVASMIAIALSFGGKWAMVGLIVLAGYILLKSHKLHKKKYAERHSAEVDELAFEDSNIVRKCIKDVEEMLKNSIEIYNQTLVGLSTEDRKLLKKINARVDDLNFDAKKLKLNLTTTLQKFRADSVETGHFYVQVIDYLREIAHSLTFVTGPSFQHIDNNHKGFNKVQQNEIKDINLKISKLFEHIIKMVSDNDFTDIPIVINMQQDILETINIARKNQIKRIKSNETGTRNSILYLGILNESKNMLLQTINLLKAQRDFILNNYDE